MEVSRDLKILVIIKGKEKKTRSKRERECRKGTRKHIQRKHNTLHYFGWLRNKLSYRAE